MQPPRQQGGHRPHHLRMRFEERPRPVDHMNPGRTDRPDACGMRNFQQHRDLSEHGTRIVNERNLNAPLNHLHGTCRETEKL